MAFCEYGLLINIKYQAKGLGRELADIVKQIAKDLGYVGTISDTFITNLPILKLLATTTDTTIIGIIPKNGYLEQYGWTDSVLSYAHYGQVPSFFKSKGIQHTSKAKL
jgi:GNAT superfamily N-acetyltransferase